MKEIVSVSLGSSKRDHEVEVELLGEKFRIRRLGTDGSFEKAIQMLKELDGKVDAFGLGGIDLYLWLGQHKYPIRDALKLKRAAHKTPIVDGSGLKNTLEREVVRYLTREAGYSLRGKTVLMTSAVDRFGMAESLHTAGCKMIFGDLIFGLHIPIPIRSYATFKVLAAMLLPVVTKMPFTILYPTGSKQEKESEEKFGRYYRQVEVIAGDFLFIRRYMPKRMRGKWILTNTVTTDDVEDLKKRGVELLVTTTPEFEGRSFGTNVMEATLIAILGKPWEEVKPEEYLSLLKKLGFKPRVEKLN